MAGVCVERTKKNSKPEINGMIDDVIFLIKYKRIGFCPSVLFCSLFFVILIHRDVKGKETERKRLEMALIIMIEMFICKLRFLGVLFQFYDFLNFRIRMLTTNTTRKFKYK